MKLNRFFFLIIIHFPFNIFCQSKISKKEALDDIEYLMKTSYDIHPNFYSLKDSSEFRNEITRINTINDSISLSDFQFHLRRNLNKIKDGHTFVYFNNNDNLLNGQIKYPFKIINKELFLIKNSTEKIKIQSINNIPSSKVYNELIELVSGEFIDYKESILEDNFLFFFHFYGKTDFLDIRHNEKREKYIILKPTKSKEPKYSFSLINDTTAVLKLSSFSFNQIAGIQYKTFIDSTFNVIKKNHKILNLLIDLSENSGGNSSYGDYVLNYLTEKPYSVYNYQILKRSKTSKKYFRNKFIKWYMYPFAIFSKQARLVVFKKRGKEQLSIKPITPKNKGYVFEGKVYLITSAKTYSAAATMVASYRNANIGKVVGLPSGQPINGFIDLIPYKLPYSKIQIATSFKEYGYMNRNNNSNRIEPDIYIKFSSFDDIKNDYKRILEKITTYNKVYKQ